MTFGLKKFQSVETNMRQLIPPLVRSTEELLNLMDASYQETVSKIIRQEAHIRHSLSRRRRRQPVFQGK